MKSFNKNIDLQNSFIILVVEDESFYKKTRKDFDLKPNILIKYRKRKILDIKFYGLSFKALFQKRILISEYFNAIPRLIGFITFSTTLSIIYGVLNHDNFKKQGFWFKKLLNPLYANKYLVVNRVATFKTLNTIHPGKVDLIYIERQKLVNKKSKNFIVWISQCWMEFGRQDIELLQQQCIDKLRIKNDLYIVLHPRDTLLKYTSYKASKKVNNISGLLELINQIGYPDKIYGMTSSALLELKDYNLEVVRIKNQLLADIVDQNQELLKLDAIDKDDI